MPKGNVKEAYAMLNGVKVPATYDETTGLWTVETTAPSASSWNLPDHVYRVELHAEDLAGNKVSMDSTDATYGDQLKIRVLEKTKPVATITSPTEGSVLGDSAQTILFEVVDTGGSGINESTITLKVNNVAIPFASLTRTDDTLYKYSYTATGLSDGANKVEVAVTDNDGNVSETATVNFVISTVAPLLTVLTPADNLITNNAAVTVTGKAKPGSNLTTLSKVTVDGVEATLDDTADEDGYFGFSLAITLKGGVNNIVVVAEDSVGKTTSVTRTATLDTTAPVITDVVAVATTVDANGTIKITFKVADA